jgi:hypothetical protein
MNVFWPVLYSEESCQDNVSQRTVLISRKYCVLVATRVMGASTSRCSKQNPVYSITYLSYFIPTVTLIPS